MKASTRFRILGTEVLGLGVFLLLVLILQLREGRLNLLVESFSWDYGIIAGTLVLVGLEILSLVMNLPQADKLKQD